MKQKSQKANEKLRRMQEFLCDFRNLYRKHFTKHQETCYTKCVIEPHKKENVKMESILNISKYVVQRYTELGKPTTNLKLQKLLYYIQGYSYKSFGWPAFDAKICNWTYGPVVPDAYFEYNQNGGREIVEGASNVIESLIEDSSLRRLIDRIIDKCQDLKASELVSKTHQEDPWKHSNLWDIITDGAIQNYFVNNDPLKLVS